MGELPSSSCFRTCDKVPRRSARGSANARNRCNRWRLTVTLTGSSSLPAIAASNANRRMSFWVASYCCLAVALLGSRARTYWTTTRYQNRASRVSMTLIATHVLEIDNGRLGLQDRQVGDSPTVVSLNTQSDQDLWSRESEGKRKNGLALTARLSNSIARAAVVFSQ